MQTQEKEKRVKRLIYQSFYRGCKETDIILGKFAKKYLYQLDDSEVDIFEKLLEENDNDIFSWVSGKAPYPDWVEGKIRNLLEKFDFSK